MAVTTKDAVKEEQATPETANENTAVEAVAQGGPVIMAGLEDFAQFKKKGPLKGMEEMSAEDIKMPKIKLVQPTSQEANAGKAKPGQYLNVTTGEATDTLRCQLIAFSKSRVKWPPKFKRGDEPLCRSFDAVHCDTENKLCANCEDCKWIDNQRPACGVVHVWMGLLPNGSPFRIMLAGSQLSHGKDFLTQVQQAGFPAFIYLLDLTSEMITGDAGTYYVPVFNFVKDEKGNVVPAFAPTQANFDNYEGIVDGLQELFTKVRIADLSDADSAGEGEGEKLF